MTVTEIKYGFRITHIDNIPYIDRVGFVLPDSPYASTTYRSIGDQSVIAKRRTIIDGIDLTQYIPFYFGPRSVMLYVIQHGYNGVEKHKPEDIVYCVIKIADLIAGNVECLFTDGHALSAFTRFYDSQALPAVNRYVSCQDVYECYWKSEKDTDLKRRKEAELLIKTSLHRDYICGYVVYNEEAKQRLLDWGIDAARIIVSKSYYF
jgi:hypothetical protein